MLMSLTHERPGRCTSRVTRGHIPVGHRHGRHSPSVNKREMRFVFPVRRTLSTFRAGMGAEEKGRQAGKTEQPEGKGGKH